MWECPVSIGQRVESDLRLNVDSIIAGAELLRDENPLHNDIAAAQSSRFGSLIACGPHAAGIHACMLPTYFTELGLGVVGIEFTVQYLRPILPDVAYAMWWDVTAVRARGSNWQTNWTGAIETPDSVSISATGSVLVLAPAR